MSREIKFRAWINKVGMLEGVTVYPTMIGFNPDALYGILGEGQEAEDENIVQYDKDSNCEILCSLLSGDDWYWMDTDYELMQYTGLKDKNGREIYEGDIVEYDNGCKGQVVFKCGQFYAYDGYASNSEDAEMKLYDDSPPFEEGFEIEVIGNIYENKDLLK